MANFATQALLLLLAAGGGLTAQTPAEALIEAGHWKRARALVEARFREAPKDPLALYLASQIHFAFGDSATPLKLAEQALALDSRCAKYHRQVAEVTGVMAQHANVFQQLLLARRFKKEIDSAILLDPNDIQALRDLMEFYLLAPTIAGGDKAAARTVANRIGSLNRAEGFSAEARLAEFDRDGEKAAELLRRAADQAPGSYKARLELARWELAPEHRNLDAAGSDAREAVRIDAGRAGAYSVLAEVYALQEKWSDLDNLLEEADAAVPDDLTPHYRAAAAMLRSGKNLESARRNLRRYLTQEPEGNEPALAEARKSLELAEVGKARPQ